MGQWICSDTADTCNCGTVLRDHNDVIEFNCCNENLHFDHTSPIRVKVRSRKRLAPGIHITQTFSGFYSEYVVSVSSQNIYNYFIVTAGNYVVLIYTSNELIKLFCFVLFFFFLLLLCNGSSLNSSHSRK